MNIQDLLQRNTALLSHLALQFNEREADDQPDSPLASAADALEENLLQAEKVLSESLRVVQTGFQRVLAPVCYIANLPVELMQKILGDVIDSSYSHEKTQLTLPHLRAFELTHVSRDWRDILAKMPSLWTDVALSLSTSPEIKLREIWKILAPRVKQDPVAVKQDPAAVKIHPVAVKIHHADSKRLTLAACNLGDMIAIDKLTLHFDGHSGSTSVFLKREYANLACRCTVLELYAGSRAPSCDVHFEETLYHFTGVKHLVIRGLGNVALGNSGKFRLLTHVTLKHLGEVFILDLVQEAHSLHTLYCLDVYARWVEPCQPIESGLRRLVLIGLANCGWVGHFTHPALEIMEITQTSLTPISDLIANTPRLLSLGCKLTSSETMIEMSKKAPQLERLVLHADIVLPICDPGRYGLVKPVFPNLQMLELWLKNISLNSLDRLIQVRCIPRGQMGSLLPKDVAQIRRLTLYWRAGARTADDSVEQIVWSSEFVGMANYKQKTMNMYRGSYVELQLEWTQDRSQEPAILPDYAEWLFDIHSSASKHYTP